MDEQTSKENPSKDFNKLDLTQLQGFSFGTQWTQDKSSPSRPGESHRSDEGGDRPQRRTGGGGGERRDRRSFRKPAAAPGDANTPAEGAGAPAEGQPQQPRRDDRPRRDQREGGFTGERGPRRDDRRDFRGGPRRDDRRPAGQGGDYRGPRREGAHEQREHTGPYFSPFYNVVFYPEDTGFAALVKAIRTSCRTYELFEIARVVIGKNDRFVATIQRKQPGREGGHNRGPRAPQQQPAGAEPQPAAPQPAPVKHPPLAISIPDGLPFDNEEAAIAHVISRHLDKFYDTADVEVEPPKGNYQIVNKCGITGELLAPPNYHLYNQIVQQHHASRLGRMNIDAFRSRIETVRDPEVVKQWLDKMKKTTRYTWKFTPPAEGAQPIAFDSFDEARSYLLGAAKDKVVRTVETARMHGKLLENLPQGEMRRAIESTLERQRRFPLDTANALRGRLRREGFTIFKKGSKGISYVCAVKRKFRVPGQTFADSIDALIAFIEANPMVKASELPAKFLGIHQLETHAAQKPEEQKPEEQGVATQTPAEPANAELRLGAEPAAAEVPAETQPAAEPAAAPPETPAPAAEAAEPAPEAALTTPPIAPATSGSVSPFPAETVPLTAEDQARLHRLTGDLRWLVSEGYVTEYIDGSLFTYPPMSEARKKEVESEEGDTTDHTPHAEASAEQPAEQPAVVEEAPAEPEPEPAPEPLAATEAAPAAEPAPAVEPAPEQASEEPKQ